MVMKVGQMVVNMLENGKMINRMVMAFLQIKKVKEKKVFGKMEKLFNG